MNTDDILYKRINNFKIRILYRDGFFVSFCIVLFIIFLCSFYSVYLLSLLFCFVCWLRVNLDASTNKGAIFMPHSVCDYIHKMKKVIS